LAFYEIPETSVHITPSLSVVNGDKVVKQNGCLCIMTILYMCVYETIYYEKQHCTL